MLKKILLGLVVVVVIFVVVVATRPSDFRVERSATIAAPAAVVFEQVNTLQNWGSWDPWAKKDPNAKTTFDGPPAGVGATMAWDGNNEVGKGKMTVTESKPAERVVLRLDFEKPMKSTSDAEFTFKADGEKTTVTWAMSGKNNFIGRAFCMFLNMEKMVGGDFEKGLAEMKAVCEAAARK
jgi:uncharacterized protein YndB with AHSA1/START domain